MICRDCGASYEDAGGCVMLCDRCLDATLYRRLMADDHVIVRRAPSGVWLSSVKNGDHYGTNMTLCNLDVMKEAIERIRDVIGMSP